MQNKLKLKIDLGYRSIRKNPSATLFRRNPLKTPHVWGSENCATFLKDVRVQHAWTVSVIQHQVIHVSYLLTCSNLYSVCIRCKRKIHSLQTDECHVKCLKGKLFTVSEEISRSRRGEGAVTTGDDPLGQKRTLLRVNYIRMYSTYCW